MEILQFIFNFVKLSQITILDKNKGNPFTSSAVWKCSFDACSVCCKTFHSILSCTCTFRLVNKNHSCIASDKPISEVGVFRNDLRTTLPSICRYCCLCICLRFDMEPRILLLLKRFGSVLFLATQIFLHN